VNGERGKMCEEVVVTYMKVVSQHLLGAVRRADPWAENLTPAVPEKNRNVKFSTMISLSALYRGHFKQI
jgi:hypothetical protein